jgi:hypothetical protein
MGVELEAELLPRADVGVTDELVKRATEAVPIHLEPVAQSRLEDAPSCFDLVDQPVDVGDEIVVDVRDVTGDHRAQEQPSESGRGVDRQYEVAERQPSRGSQRAGVPQFEFGEQHGGCR